MKKILKFYSKTCGPCKVMSNKLTELKDVEIQEVDIMDDNNENLLDEYNISTVPTIVILAEDNTPLARFTGIIPIEDIKKVITNTNIEENNEHN